MARQRVSFIPAAVQRQFANTQQASTASNEPQPGPSSQSDPPQPKNNDFFRNLFKK